LNLSEDQKSNVIALRRPPQLEDNAAWLRGAWGWLFDAWRDVCSRTCPWLLEGEDVELRSARWLTAVLSDFSRTAIARWDERWLKRLLDIARFRLAEYAGSLTDPPQPILTVPVSTLITILRPAFRRSNRGAAEIGNILSDAALLCALSIGGEEDPGERAHSQAISARCLESSSVACQ
jgi:hypothetical protein